jgi:hypothetical protein
MKYLVLIFFYALLADHFTVLAQASLAAENIIDDVSVTTSNGNGKVRPKMTILRYQYTDPGSNDTKEGGVLVATFTYAIEPECVEQVKAQIKQRKSLTMDITLSAIPLNTSTIDFLSSSNEFIGNVEAKSVSAISGATSASQEMTISYNLTGLGASVMSALSKSGGGIPVRANITYNGLSAPCGYKINGQWDNVYRYFG